MEIIRSIKCYEHKDRLQSILLLYYHGIQMIALIMLPLGEKLLQNLCQLLLLFVKKNGEYEQKLIEINFSLHLALLFALVSLKFLSRKNVLRKVSNSLLGFIIPRFKFVFLLPVLNVNSSVLINQGSEFLKFIALFNLIFAIGLGVLGNLTNWSYRFKQKDFIARRENPHFEFILLCMFAVSKEFLGNYFAIGNLIILSVVKLKQQTSTMEYQLIQKTQVFFSILHIYISLFSVSYLEKDLPFNLTGFLFDLTIGAFICRFAADRYVRKINYDHFVLEEVGKFKSQDENNANFQNRNSQVKKDINTIFILSRILCNLQIFTNQKEVSNQQSRNWWNQSLLIVLQHKKTCTFVDCCCRTKDEGWEKEIISCEMEQFLKGFLQQNKNQSSFDLFSIYFNMELAQKPLKAYLNIIKMKNQVNDNFINVELDCVIEEAREEFQKIFYVHNIQNDSIPMLKIAEFEIILTEVEQKLGRTAQKFIEFYEIFYKKSAKISDILLKQQQIIKLKKSIEHTLQILIKDYPNDTKTKVFTFVFYRFFQMYRSRQKQFNFLAREKKIRNKILSKEEDNYFKPEYGVIYIDMFEERGKIKKITKNVCQSFGYKMGEMLEFNIKKFMPNIYAKNHAKFLNNFVEKGEIKALKIKKRLLMAKNKNQFIFPIQTKFKTEHLFEKEFGVSCLLKCLQTKSGYIMIGKKGKIEEMSENVYEKIFQKCNLELMRIKNFSITNMIPEVVKIINNEQYSKENVFKSHLIFTKNWKFAQQKFKVDRGQQKVVNQASKMPDVSKSSSYQENQSSTLTTEKKKPKKLELSLDYCSESYKKFNTNIDYNKLVNYQIRYKVNKLITKEFQLFLIEIISFGEEQKKTGIIVQEYKNYQSFLGIQSFDAVVLFSPMGSEKQQQQEDQKKAPKIKKKKIKAKDCKFKMQNNKSLMISSNDCEEGENRYTKIFNEERESESLNLLNQDQMIEKKICNENRSCASKVDQSNIQKQILENAFNMNKSGRINMKTGICIGLVILIPILMGLLAFETINGLNMMQTFGISKNFLVKISETYEYQYSLSQIQKFYKKREQLGFTNSNNIQNVRQKKKQISRTFSQYVKNMDKYSKNIDYNDKTLNFIDPVTNETRQITLIYLLNRLEYTFKNQDDPISQKDLQINYINVRSRLEQLKKGNQDQQKSQMNLYSLVQWGLLGFYQLLIIIILTLSLCIYSNHCQKQKKIHQFMSSISKKQLKKVNQIMIILKNQLSLQKLADFPEIMDQIDELEQESEEIRHQENVLKNLQISYMERPNKLKKSIILGIFIISFIVLSTYPVFMIVNYRSASEDEGKIQDVFSRVTHLQRKSPTIINIYLTNLNRIMHNQPTMDFSKFYQESNEDIFEIVEAISQIYNGQKELKRKSALSKQLCDIVDCSGLQETHDQTLVYHVLDIKQKMGYMRDFDFGEQATPQLVEQWVQENNMNFTFGWVISLYDFTVTWNRRLSNLILGGLAQTKRLIYIVCSLLIPLNLVILFLTTKQLIVYLNSILIRAEQIFMLFPKSIISENAYLMNYFKQQVKKMK